LTLSKQFRQFERGTKEVLHDSERAILKVETVETMPTINNPEDYPSPCA
jgi:hypothetical protein